MIKITNLEKFMIDSVGYNYWLTNAINENLICYLSN